MQYALHLTQHSTHATFHYICSLTELEENEGGRIRPSKVKVKVFRVAEIRDILLFENEDYLVFNKPPAYQPSMSAQRALARAC